MVRLAPALVIVLEFVRAEQAEDAHAFRFATEEYLVRGPGGGYARVEVAWNAELLADLEAVRQADGDPGSVNRVGERLRRILAPAGWAQHELSIADAVQQQRPVEITLRSAAAELYALPWELLVLRTTGQHLGGLPGVLIRYAWPETAAPASRAPDASRVLVAWSAAAGAVPASEHIAAIQRACLAGGRSFDPARDVVPHASLGRIVDALGREGPPVSVLHILCHGGVQGPVFGLALHGEQADDEPVIVGPARLQQALAPLASTLRVVVLAACDGGNSGEPGNRIGSAAQMLHRAGIAAVLASRYPLSTAGSTRLAGSFHGAMLGERHSLAAAFLAARDALACDVTSLDWASVQLHAHDVALAEAQRQDWAPPARVDPPAAAGVDAPAPITAPTRRWVLPLAVVASAALAFAIAWEWPDDETPTTQGPSGHKPVADVTVCAPRVQESIQAAFPSSGTRPVAISIMVGPEGRPHIERGGVEAADEADAIAALQHVDPRVIVAEHDGPLPCRVRFDWKR